MVLAVEGARKVLGGDYVVAGHVYVVLKGIDIGSTGLFGNLAEESGELLGIGNLRLEVRLDRSLDAVYGGVICKDFLAALGLESLDADIVSAFLIQSGKEITAVHNVVAGNCPVAGTGLHIFNLVTLRRTCHRPGDQN